MLKSLHWGLLKAPVLLQAWPKSFGLEVNIKEKCYLSHFLKTNQLKVAGQVTVYRNLQGVNGNLCPEVLGS